MSLQDLKITAKNSQVGFTPIVKSMLAKVKDFNKLMIITQTYLPNITSTYAKNELLRLI
jgi:hypothetical protein